MTDTPPPSLRAAEDALMDRLEAWAKGLGARFHVTDEQQEVLCRVMRDTYDSAASAYKIRVEAAKAIAAKRSRAKA